MMAYAVVVKRCYELQQKGVYVRPIRLMIGAMVSGYWELMEVFEHELKLNKVPLDFGRECVTAIAKPQQMSDQDINILYNSCDIGLNTCEGEGFGLCQLEHAAVGCPQVAPRIGGLKDFLTDDHALLVDAKWRYHIDKQRDGIGGTAEVGDHMDYADAIWKYYTDPQLCEDHAKKARRYILQHYKWDVVVANFRNILHDVATK
jgi:glycosyltransferase involved in cell wall biosynthesis